MTDTLRIATRKSQLALWQAEYVADALKQAHQSLKDHLTPFRMNDLPPAKSYRHLDLVAFRIFNFLGTELVHHRLGDVLVGTRPDVHNLVIAFAIGHETGTILVLDLLNLGLRNRKAIGATE